MSDSNKSRILLKVNERERINYMNSLGLAIAASADEHVRFDLLDLFMALNKPCEDLLHHK